MTGGMGARGTGATVAMSKEEQLLQDFRAAEQDAEHFARHPELLEPYRGQWVITHRTRVIAHSPDGSAIARRHTVRDHPGSRMFYVPTREEAGAVLIL